nr:hypothetical protein [Tanacetum cinerariifolium]
MSRLETSRGVNEFTEGITLEASLVTEGAALEDCLVTEGATLDACLITDLIEMDDILVAKQRTVDSKTSSEQQNECNSSRNECSKSRNETRSSHNESYSLGNDADDVSEVKNKREKDTIITKPDKNGKRGEARKSQEQSQSIKQEN